MTLCQRQETLLPKRESQYISWGDSFQEVSLSSLSFALKANEVTKRLMEEEEACQVLANSTRKLEADAKRFKEEVENMEEK